jgi:hypothetical protein
LLLGFEVKSVEHTTKNVPQKLKEAAGQMANRNGVLKRFHNDISDTTWTYVRACVLPFISSLEDWEEQWSSSLNACDYCRHFILDSSKLEDLDSWLRKLTEMQPKIFPLDHQYENLVTRIVGFLLVSESEPPYTKLPLVQRQQMTRMMNEMAVIGTDSGVTSERPLKEDLEVKLLEKKEPAPKQKKGSDKASHLSSLRTVALWNKEQLAVLQSGRKQVILDADYGCGKTLLLKSAALQLAAKQEELGKDEKIFFFSAASACWLKVSAQIFASKHLYIFS